MQETCRSVRASLQEAGDDLQGILEARAQATRTRAQLQALLRLDDEVRNLDQVLGLSDAEGNQEDRRPPLKIQTAPLDGLGPHHRPERRIASHKSGKAETGPKAADAQLSPYETLYVDSDDEGDDPDTSLSFAFSRQRSVEQVSRDSKRDEQVRSGAPVPSIDLAAKWSNLERIRKDYRSALEQGPSSFVKQLESKLQKISETLQGQAETLMRTLLSTERGDGSLLFGTVKGDDESWRESVLGRASSLGQQDWEAARAEQESWLRLCMLILGNAGEEGEQGKSRALEVLSDALIAPALKKVSRR